MSILLLIRRHTHRLVRTKMGHFGCVWLIYYASRFYGICLGQTHFYFRNYPSDPIAMRLIVGLLWVLDTTQLILVVQSIFDYTIMWKGNIAEVNIVSPYVYINYIRRMIHWHLESRQFEVSLLLTLHSLAFILIYCFQASMVITVCTLVSRSRTILTLSNSQ